MAKPRKKLITSAVLLLGIAVLIVAGITFQRPLRERYWLWKLETGTEEEQLEAAVNLGESKSAKAVPSLIETLAAVPERSDWEWQIELPGSATVQGEKLPANWASSEPRTLFDRRVYVRQASDGTFSEICSPSAVRRPPIVCGPPDPLITIPLIPEPEPEYTMEAVGFVNQ